VNIRFLQITPTAGKLQSREKSILKMLQVEILRGVVVDGDDVKADGPVVVYEFLVLGTYTSIEV